MAARRIQSPTKVAEFIKFLIDQEPRTLMNILNRLPKMGIGRKVTRVTWNIQDPNFLVRPAYWTITKVIPNESMVTGEVWGTFCHRGNPSPKIRHVRSSERRQWLLLPRDFESKKLLNTDENDVT